MLASRGFRLTCPGPAIKPLSPRSTRRPDLPRLIFGNSQGIWSVLDNNGVVETTIGSRTALPSVNRNGNLQLTQFYYGAVQPSNVAAQMAGALFYGAAQDNGGPSSDPNILSNGNLTWSVPDPCFAARS